MYEIYYSPKQRDDNEYLCTVRCGIAVKDQAPDMCRTGESSATCIRDSKEGLDEGCKDDNSNSNDDEWVQVKAPKSAVTADATTSFLLKKNYINVVSHSIHSVKLCFSILYRLHVPILCWILTWMFFV